MMIPRRNAAAGARLIAVIQIHRPVATERRNNIAHYRAEVKASAAGATPLVDKYHS